MFKKELTKYLDQLSKEELKKEVEKLYKEFKPVQEYYSLELGNNSAQLLNEYKKKLERLFRPKGSFLNPSITEANRIISAFSKVSVYPVDLIDLMLFKVELIKNFLEEWGHEYTSMFISFISTYEKVVDLIHANNLYENFENRRREVEAYGMNCFLINKTL